MEIETITVITPYDKVMIKGNFRSIDFNNRITEEEAILKYGKKQIYRIYLCEGIETYIV